MKSYQRVARLHMGKVAKKSVTFTTGSDVLSDLYVEANLNGSVVGRLDALPYVVSRKKILRSFKCSEDMIRLLKPDQSHINVLEVLDVEIDVSLRGQGFGNQIYIEAAKEYFKQIRKPFLFIPNYCTFENTSPSALRVWKSLTRKYPSSGDVILYNGGKR